MLGRLIPKAFFTGNSRALSTKQLVHAKFGDPTHCIDIEEKEIDPNPGEGEVQLEWLASPVNPADINMIQGNYALKPNLPAVGGNEGVAKVSKVGPGVSSLNEGDWVLPIEAGLGTWRTHSINKAEHLCPIRNDLPLHYAATSMVNPPTAYRMLKDFVDLEPGDVILQNGANSNVGRAVIQIAKEFGLRTINIVRDRPTHSDLDSELRALGATVVLTDDDFRGSAGKKAIKFLGQSPKLALNCVGGKSTVHMVAALAPRGKMVTYGAMSKMPFHVPTGPMIFRQVEMHGFWMSKWYTIEKNLEERKVMMDALADMVLNKRLAPPDCDEHSLENYKDAIESAFSGSANKQLFVMNSNKS